MDILLLELEQWKTRSDDLDSLLYISSSSLVLPRVYGMIG